MDTDTDVDQLTPMDLAIHHDVYDAALERARSQGHALAAVARTILFREAGKTPESVPVPEGRPPLREYGQLRKRLKFKVGTVHYAAARDRIHAGGRTVAAAIEDGLRQYAQTGNL